MLKLFLKSLLLIILLLTILSADTLWDKEQELSRIQQELDHQKFLLQQTRQQEYASLRDLYLINRKIETVKGNLYYNQLRLQQQIQALEQTRLDLLKTTNAFRDRRQILAKRIQEIYKNRDPGLIGLLFSNKSFSDIVDDSFYYRKILEKDLDTINNLSHLRREISQKKVILEYQKNIIEKTHRSITQQKKIYEIRANEKREVYTNLKAQREEYERKVNELLVNSKEIETMIKTLMRQRTSVARGTGNFSWPARGMITSYYGRRRHPIFRTIKMHTGIDLAVNTGTRVRAADSGVVIFSGWWGGYGRAVIVDHGHGYSTVYAHLLRSYVNANQTIEKRQIIGLSGNSGYSTGPHLHFEIRRNGETVDPLRYLP